MPNWLAAVIDGYFDAVEWIAKNPAKTLWFSVIAIVALVILK